MTLSAKRTFEAIGTQWSIETEHPLSAELARGVDDEIASFSSAYSRFDHRSRVSQLAESTLGHSIEFPASVKAIVALYRQFEMVTEGALNPLVGRSLERLGYTADYTLRPHHNYRAGMPAPSLASLQLAETSLSLTEPALLDIGAIGKGYLVDRIYTVIETHHDQYVIDASGDLRVRVDTPQMIGLESPFDSTRVIGSVRLSHGSLCASAPNRRAWGDGLHHIIDARTGLPANTTVAAIWVLAPRAMLADGLASALFFVSPEKLHHVFGPFKYGILHTDGTMSHTIDSIGEVYT